MNHFKGKKLIFFTFLGGGYQVETISLFT